MKKILFTLFLCVAVLRIGSAANDIPTYESFPTNYANGARLRDLASFDAGNSLGSGSNLTNSWAAGLTYPGLVGSNSTGGVIANGIPGSGRDAGFQLNPVVTFSAVTNSLYASFLLKIQTSPTGTNLIALFSGGTGGGATPVAGVYLDSNNKLWISKSSATPATNTAGSLVVGETNLVVFRYRFSAAQPDEVALWLNPGVNTFGADESGVPASTISTTNASDSPSVASFILAHRTTAGISASGFKYLDEIRVATNWAAVTPPTTPATNSPTPQPRITQSFLSGGNLVLRGTNGVSNGVYQVLSSTLVVTPMTNWPAIGTNLFDASGNFDCTNPVSPSDAQRFYRILVGGQFTQPTVIAPSITTQPTNLTVLAGQTATFYGAANGTAPLAYQWFFNTNTPLANGTNATYGITNAQAVNEGSYTLRVTNSAGSVTSVVATLTVNVPPSITAQPQSQTVTASNAAAFTVVAAGDAPLSYQWYFSNALILNGTNGTYAINGVTTNNAGNYFVVVTNNFGAVTSSVATLTVNAASGAPDFSITGFATLSGFSSNGTLRAGGTTGGAGGIHVQVWTALELANHLQSNATLIIQVMTNIDLGIASLAAGITQPTYSNFLAAEVLVRSHKTLYSTNGSTLSHGTLRMGKPSLGAQQNIIIRNLKFADLWEFDPTGNYDSKGWDYVHLEEGSHHVWVDHCDFDKVYDGIIDVVHASDYVTVSWCVFRDQKKCSLVGHSNTNEAEDTGHLNVTFHHNYYVNVDERLPRMRFGNAHVFNLYCEDLGGNGIQSTCEAATLVENSYFYHPVSTSLPTREENGTASGLPNNGKGFLKVVNSTIVNLPAVNVQFRQFGEATFQFNSPFVSAVPPYPYTLDVTASVPNIVTNWSGVNKVTSLP